MKYFCLNAKITQINFLNNEKYICKKFVFEKNNR